MLDSNWAATLTWWCVNIIGNDRATSLGLEDLAGYPDLAVKLSSLLRWIPSDVTEDRVAFVVWVKRRIGMEAWNRCIFQFVALNADRTDGEIKTICSYWSTDRVEILFVLGMDLHVADTRTICEITGSITMPFVIVPWSVSRAISEIILFNIVAFSEILHHSQQHALVVVEQGADDTSSSLLFDSGILESYWKLAYAVGKWAHFLGGTLLSSIILA